MNEVRESFNETVKERSQVARSAFNKGNGPATTALGKKQLSNKEIEERHGPVKTYTFDDFLSFQEFREMPKDWQVSYINHLQDKYDIGLAQINRDLFGQRDNNVLRSHLKMRGIISQVNPNKPRAKSGLEQFKRDILVYRTKEAPKVEETEEKELRRFMTWDVFKILDTDSMMSFIGRIVDEYKIGIKNIDIELFGHTKTNLLRKLLLSRGILNQFQAIKGSTARGNAYKANLKRFKEDIQKWKEETGMCIKEKEAEPVEEVLKTKDIPMHDPITGENFMANPEEVRKIAEKYNETLKKYSDEPEEPERLEVIATEQKVYHTTYRGNAIDFEELKLVAKMFENMKIRVELTVCTV